MKRAADDDTGAGKRWGAAAVIRDYGGVAPLAMSLTVEVREAMRTYMQQECFERIGHLLLTVSPGSLLVPQVVACGALCDGGPSIGADVGGCSGRVGPGEEAGPVQEWYQQLSVPGLWHPWSIQGSRRCPLCTAGPTLWGGRGA